MRRALIASLLLAGCGGGESSDAEDAGEETTVVAVDGSSDVALDSPPPSGPPALDPIADRTVAEDELLSVPITTDAAWLTATGLPPGARIVGKSIVFRPDFIQGGGAPYTVTVRAKNALGTREQSFKITITDSIQPPALTITKTEDLGSCRRLTLSQKTDAYTDSAGYAGRSFTAIAVVPKTTNPAVRVALHGVGGSPNASLGCNGLLQVEPHDPMTSYWWGYSENLPSGAATSGKVPPYTARRVLQLVEWAQRAQGGDPERTFVTGTSMGGAGAMHMGLLWARHFAGVDAWWGQSIAKNHRPARIATLVKLWGTRELNLDDGAGMGVWDRLDLTRALRDDAEAAGQFVFLKHGKDDDTIHFGAVSIASPLTGQSFYQALRGHPYYAVWDEGAHGPADPVLGDRWWDGGWSRISDATASLRRDRLVPAFRNASHDGDPGDGTGNGKVPWDANAGYAANVSVPGDTGWKGDLAGVLNRHLRWDGTKIVDTDDRIELPLRVYSGTGKPAPRAGYPTIDDQVGAKLPVTIDVVLRRVQRFLPAPGEVVAWTCGAQKGELTVPSDGVLTIPGLSIGNDWVTLTVQR